MKRVAGKDPPPHSNSQSSLYLSITGYRIRIGKHKSGYTPGTKPRGIRELPPPRAENETRCCKTQPTGFFFVFFPAPKCQPKRQHSTPATQTPTLDGPRHGMGIF